MKKSMLVAVVSALLAGALPAKADVADFYKGKQVIFYVGYGPGGGYDVYSRVTARYWGKYIPGNPSVVVQNRPGGGSALVANELYNTYPKDGSVVAMFSASLPLWDLLGQANLRFDSTKFSWIGSLTDADDLMAIRRDKGVSDFSGAKEKELIIGVPGATSSPAMMVTAVNHVLGTKFKLVTAYPGSAEIRLGVERGELDGNQSLLWSVDQDWVKKNNYLVLYRVGTTELTGLEGVPSLLSLAKTEDEKSLMRFFTSYTDIGRPVVAPPNIPQERLEALRSAFSHTMKDPTFLTDIQKSGLRLNPLTGEKLQKVVEDSFNLSDELKARAKSAVKLLAEEDKKTAP